MNYLNNSVIVSSNYSFNFFDISSEEFFTVIDFVKSSGREVCM